VYKVLKFCISFAFSAGLELTTRLYLVLRLSVCGGVPFLPHTSSWCDA